MSKEWILRLIGVGVGLLAGILLLTIGFWKTLLLFVLGGIGWFMGGNRKLPPRFYQVLERIHFPWEK